MLMTSSICPSKMTRVTAAAYDESEEYDVLGVRGLIARRYACLQDLAHVVPFLTFSLVSQGHAVLSG